MAITPDTDIYLLKCPLELSDEHQLRFASANAQATYFLSLPKLEAEDCTYQRKDSVIRFPAHVDTIMEYNYVMYRNNNYSDKWFYAFITNMEFVSPSMTLITIKTDVWQTWQFDLTFHKSFIERECVSDDTVGKHTLPEGLEVGEYIGNGALVEQDLGSYSSSIVIAGVSTLKDNQGHEIDYPTYVGEVNPWQNIYGGVISGLTFLAFDSPEEAQKLAHTYDKWGIGEAVVEMFVVSSAILPDSRITWTNGTDGNGGLTGHRIGFIQTQYNSQDIGSFTSTRPTQINGYTPKNNKLLCYPFQYLYLTNNAGGDQVYHWEDFTNGVATFQTNGVIGPSCSIKTYPKNYKGMVGNKDGYNYGIIGPKLPIASWSSDIYTNWLTQNALAQSWSVTSTVLNAFTSPTGLSGATKNLLSTADSIMNVELAKTAASFTPDQAKGNISCGDINWGIFKTCFTLHPMSCKAEYAKIADQFFSMFGYKVNTVKDFELHSRQYWNYIKTIGAIITADIPQQDLDEIKTLFNNGLTLWHDTNNFLNYSLTNTIL